MTSGQRVSIALFTPKGLKKLPPRSVEELADIGFFPPLSAQAAEAPPTADHCPPCLLPSLAVLLPLRWILMGLRALHH